MIGETRDLTRSGEYPVSQLVDGLSAFVEGQLHCPITAAGLVGANKVMGFFLAIDHPGNGGLGAPAASAFPGRRNYPVTLVFRGRIGYGFFATATLFE